MSNGLLSLPVLVAVASGGRMLLLAKTFGVRSLGRGDALRPLDVTLFFSSNEGGSVFRSTSQRLPVKASQSPR